MRQLVMTVLLAAVAFGTAVLLSCSSSASSPSGPAQLVWDDATWDTANWQ